MLCRRCLLIVRACVCEQQVEKWSVTALACEVLGGEELSGQT